MLDKLEKRSFLVAGCITFVLFAAGNNFLLILINDLSI